MTCYWLNGATLSATSTNTGPVFLYAWTQPHYGVIVFVWCAEGQTRILSSADRFTTTDIYGASISATTIGEEPVLFHFRKGVQPNHALETIRAAIRDH